jgi:hypothetical protein
MNRFQFRTRLRAPTITTMDIRLKIEYTSIFRSVSNKYLVIMAKATSWIKKPYSSKETAAVKPVKGDSVFDRLHSKDTAASKSQRMKKEDQEIRRRQLEDAELTACTFRPNTKWNLVSERLEKARMQKERTEYEENRSPNQKEIQKQRSKTEELNAFTFKPRLTWNLVAERREKARRQEYEKQKAPKKDRKLTVSIRQTHILS